jgi:DNA-binding YbaB/EbfC family protein
MKAPLNQSIEDSMDINNLMKQAQQMQEKMKSIQDDLANTEVRGESGAGLVTVTMTGRHDVKAVELDESLFKESKEVMEDLIASAVNDAVRRVESNQKEKMSALTGGIPMPPGFKLPF